MSARAVTPVTPVEIETLQADIIYTFTTPDLEKFNSLGSIMAGDVVFGDDGSGYIGDRPPSATFRHPCRAFDADGNLIADSSNGFNTDAFLLTRFEQNTTYYVRIRSDAFENTVVTDPQSGNPDDVSFGELVRIRQQEPNSRSITRLGSG